jgi:hypothetical protein
MIKISLILLTLVSVTVDTLLLPFYPKFFASAFDATAPWITGAYLASSCVTIMVFLPIWAKVAKSIHELDLWIVTQLAAAALGISCYFITDLWLVWTASQVMLAFKASYLLIYPFVLRLESRDNHLGLIGLFSVLMHIGGIGGAFLGSIWLSTFTAKAAYLLMASADVLQVIICLILKNAVDMKDRALDEDKRSDKKRPNSFPLLIKLCSISVVVYFSAFLIRPFFTQHWQAISDWNSPLLTALIYAIPALGAVGILLLEHIKKQSLTHQQHLMLAMAIAICAAILQGQEFIASVVIGRICYAWALYQMTVRLELILFEASPKTEFGEHFATLHVSQNIGLIAASFASAALVANISLQAPFFMAGVGFVMAFALTCFLLRKSSPSIQGVAS